MILVPRLLVAAIDDYLKNNSSVHDLPSVPLLEASRGELNAQIKWAEEAVVTLKRKTDQQPETSWIEKVRELALGLRETLDEHAMAGAERVCELARHANVYVKVSALACYSTQSYPFRNLHDPLKRVIETFGARRSFWGSDFCF